MTTFEVIEAKFRALRFEWQKKQSSSRQGSFCVFDSLSSFWTAGQCRSMNEGSKLINTVHTNFQATGHEIEEEERNYLVMERRSVLPSHREGGKDWKAFWKSYAKGYIPPIVSWYAERPWDEKNTICERASLLCDLQCSNQVGKWV